LSVSLWQLTRSAGFPAPEVGSILHERTPERTPDLPQFQGDRARG
jgi:hypothetical protein